MKAEPQKEHNWLHKCIGDWEFEVEAIMAPDQPPQKSKGTEQVRSLGGLWILAEGQGEMPGCGPANTLMTLGYDPEKKRIVGSWIGSMMTSQWLYDGELNEIENVLTLNSEGPSMAGDGSIGKYRDVIEFKNDDHRILSALHLDKDGQWKQFMTTHYRRKQTS